MKKIETIETIETIEIEKDSLEFLYAVCFGNDREDKYKAASNRAYRDFNRTIRFDRINDSIRKRLREETTESIREFIQGVQEQEEKGYLSQDEFDDRHCDLSDRIIEKYRIIDKNRNESLLTYGQAQKWINMTIKYLYVLDDTEIKSIVQYCHVPLDKYILKYAKEKFGIKQEKEEPWSRWNDYDKYLKYQKSLREKIEDECPLRWEIKAWMAATRKD